MTQPLKIESQVGQDGVLTLRVPLQQADANRRVLITIEPVASPDVEEEDWHDFIKRTYGSCAGLGLEEVEELPLVEREPLE